MNETSCPTCEYPEKEARDRLADDLRLPKTLNVLEVPNFGKVPILKGDVTWINYHVMRFVKENVGFLRPSAVRFCNGSVFEAEELREILIKTGTGPVKGGADEISIFSSNNREANEDILAGKWVSNSNFEFLKKERFEWAMKGRTMYVVPFAMGPIGGKGSIYGVVLTDDPILVLTLRCVYRVSSSIWDAIGTSQKFAKIVHSIGMPRPVLQLLVNTESRLNPIGTSLIFEQDDQKLHAFGADFAKNSQRFTKTLGLKFGAVLGMQIGFLAEEGQILKVTNGSGKVAYFYYAGSEKNDLESLKLTGWKFETLISGTIWITVQNGKILATCPENDEMKTLSKPENLQNLSNGTPEKFEIFSWNPQETQWDKGVPLSGLIFATHRSDKYPSVLEANHWNEGVVLGAGLRRTVKNGTTLEHVPMVGIKDHLTFSFAKYLENWLHVGIVPRLEGTPEVPIFFTNLGQEEDAKALLEKILEHIFNRSTNPSDVSNVLETPIGKLSKMFANPQIDTRFWIEELATIKRFFETQMGANRVDEVDKILNELATKL